MNPAWLRARRQTQMLADALPYIRSLYAKTVVIHIGDHPGDDGQLMPALARDIALLKLVGVKPIIVHGHDHDEQIHDTVLLRLRLINRNQHLIDMINQYGSKAIGLTGQDGLCIHAIPAAPSTVLHMPHFADISSIEAAVIHLLHSNDFVPVIAPLGTAPDGTLVPLSANRLAALLARSLKADKLIDMLDQADFTHLTSLHRTLLTANELANRIKQGWASRLPPSLRSLLDTAIDAVRTNVQTIHLIDRQHPSALLLELLTSEGIGITIRSDHGPHFIADSTHYLDDDACSVHGLPPRPPQRIVRF